VDWIVTVTNMLIRGLT